jgi:hypothetical protein
MPYLTANSLQSASSTKVVLPGLASKCKEIVLSDEASVCLTAYQTVRTLIVLVTVVVLFILHRKCCQELQVVLFRDLLDTL